MKKQGNKFSINGYKNEIKNKIAESTHTGILISLYPCCFSGIKTDKNILFY